LKVILSDLRTQVPPIKGCIQGSMILRVRGMIHAVRVFD
jgi:hypothetical protein